MASGTQNPSSALAGRSQTEPEGQLPALSGSQVWVQKPSEPTEVAQRRVLQSAECL